MLISSATNPRIKHARKLLRQRKFREQHGEFVVEGVQAVAEALAQGWRLRQVYYHDESVRSEKALQVLDELDAHLCIELTRPVLTRLSERPDNPSELIAVIASPRDDLARVPVSNDMLAVVLEEPRDPGNLGTVIRTADALGVGGVVLLGPTVDLYGPKTVRATMGSLFAVPVAHVPDVDGLAGWITRIRAEVEELRVVATVARDAGAIHEQDFRGATLVVVGNERRGVSDELRAACDTAATIPMSGSAESLNSAVATSIVLYEACRQRAARG
ncbi:RNA methyltransferase [Candidatus Poribacteria bacterium]|nr:RNA methyltransferase [Candidatus Poribacteria bacterium]MBT5535179.1 RNA methyltransferase [Candidatus Poribacteria bacterium]MBT5710658.1 RNA methyltransferase [Candidatus Poribacteria bacterium]MBT7095908.1 RNA methyltransferase [Candidatus Poribacteria bacterium]MBT7808170.1 RNA methyltransferase [Candidatus Poribacteria bacterium]